MMHNVVISLVEKSAMNYSIFHFSPTNKNSSGESSTSGLNILHCFQTINSIVYSLIKRGQSIYGEEEVRKMIQRIE